MRRSRVLSHLSECRAQRKLETTDTPKKGGRGPRKFSFGS